MAKDQSKTRMYVREFVNEKKIYAGAYVLLSVEDTTGSSLERSWSDITCEIADCHQRINLQFELGGSKERRNSVRKADKLARVFTAFAQAIRAEAAVVSAREKEYAKRKKALAKQGMEETEIRRRLREADRL